MLLVEVNNNKIYRIYDDLSMNVQPIHRRTNEMCVFEYLIRNNELPIQPKRLIPPKNS